jgi:molecular chaperone DnaK
LSDTDIDKMVKDAEAHAEEDKKRRALVEAKNQADGLIHTTEQTLSEAGDKVPESEKAPVQAAIQALKDVVGGDDVEQIKAKTEALAQVAMKLGETMYKAQQEGPQPGNPGAGPGAGPQGHDDKVVDADFEEVDEKKRGSA